MATQKIGTLEADITANTSGLTKAEKQVEKTTKNVEKSFGSMGTKMTSVAKSMAAALSVATIVNYTRALSQAIDEQAKFADRIGISFEELQKLEFAATQTGVAVGSLRTGLQRMTRRVSEAANGTGEAKKALEEMGVSAAYLNTLKPEEQFKEIADAFENIDNQSDRVRLAMRLFDTEGVALVNTMKGGRQAIEDFGDSISVVTREAAKNFEWFNDQVSKQVTMTSAFWGNLAGDMIGAFRKASGDSSLEDLDKKMRQVMGNIVDLQSDIAKGGRDDATVKAQEMQIARLTEQYKALWTQRKALADQETGIDPETGNPEIVITEGKDARKDELAKLQFRARALEDSNAAIEAEILAHQIRVTELYGAGTEDALAAEEALQDRRIQLYMDADDQINKNQDDMLNQRNRIAQNTWDRFFQLTNEAAEQGFGEGNAIAKAAFFAMKAIQVAQIISATEVAAAQASAVAAVGGPLAWASTAAGIRVAGYASAGLVAGMAIGGGRQFGGQVSGSLATPVNEGDTPEMLVRNGKQFLLGDGKGGKVVPLGGNSGGMSEGITVNVISHGTPQTVTGQSMSKGEVSIMINDAVNASEGRINSSLSSGRGDTAQSLERGFKVGRNI